MAEIRTFTVDPAILFSIINSQAGTLAKAMLEAVMNAIDAGATKCEIDLGQGTFVCRDNGRGFASREEILNWFERFGTPHTEGDAIYGKFRMGRGQMMAFARTVWRTGKFLMDVDIKNRGLDYSLGELDKPVKGCHIEGTLYQQLSAYELRNTLSDIEALVQYAQIPVFLNGKKVSKDPSKLKWDIETDDAYIKLTSASDLKVYNLGVLVRAYGSYRFGSGGVVVSKRALQVNFARNDILDQSCEVWRRIRAELSDRAKVKVAKKATLTDSEREFVARNIMAGDVKEGSTESRIITVATGSHVPLSSLLSARGKVCLAPSEGHRLAERLHRAKVGMVISPRTLERFGVESLGDLLDRLKNVFGRGSWGFEVVSFDELANGYTTKYTPVLDNEASPGELAAIRVLRAANLKLGAWLEEETDGSLRTRKLLLGSSDAAMAWTDGKSVITVEKRFLLRAARKGLDGWMTIFMVLLHEYCHSNADLDGHEHPLEFFEQFESLACTPNPVASLALACAAKFMDQCMAAGLAVSKAAARSMGGRRELAMVNGARSMLDGDTAVLRQSA